jgi:hypothetical protein
MIMSFIIQKRKAKNEQGGTPENTSSLAFSETGNPPAADASGGKVR